MSLDASATGSCLARTAAVRRHLRLALDPDALDPFDVRGRLAMYRLLVERGQSARRLRRSRRACLRSGVTQRSSRGGADRSAGFGLELERGRPRPTRGASSRYRSRELVGRVQLRAVRMILYGQAAARTRDRPARRARHRRLRRCVALRGSTRWTRWSRHDRGDDLEPVRFAIWRARHLASIEPRGAPSRARISRDARARARVRPAAGSAWSICSVPRRCRTDSVQLAPSRRGRC